MPAHGGSAKKKDAHGNAHGSGNGARGARAAAAAAPLAGPAAIDTEELRRVWHSMALADRLKTLRFEEPCLVERAYAIQQMLWYSDLICHRSGVSACARGADAGVAFPLAFQWPEWPGQGPGSRSHVGVLERGLCTEGGSLLRPSNHHARPAAFSALQAFVQTADFIERLDRRLCSGLLASARPRPLLPREAWVSIFEPAPTSWSEFECQIFRLVELALADAHQHRLREGLPLTSPLQEAEEPTAEAPEEPETPEEQRAEVPNVAAGSAAALPGKSGKRRARAKRSRVSCGSDVLPEADVEATDGLAATVDGGNADFADAGVADSDAADANTTEEGAANAVLEEEEENEAEEEEAEEDVDEADGEAGETLEDAVKEEVEDVSVEDPAHQVNIDADAYEVEAVDARRAGARDTHLMGASLHTQSLGEGFLSVHSTKTWETVSHKRVRTKRALDAAAPGEALTDTTVASKALPSGTEPHKAIPSTAPLGNGLLSSMVSPQEERLPDGRPSSGNSHLGALLDGEPLVGATPGGTRAAADTELQDRGPLGDAQHGRLSAEETAHGEAPTLRETPVEALPGAQQSRTVALGRTLQGETPSREAQLCVDYDAHPSRGTPKAPPLALGVGSALKLGVHAQWLPNGLAGGAAEWRFALPALAPVASQPPSAARSPGPGRVVELRASVRHTFLDVRPIVDEVEDVPRRRARSLGA